MRRITLWGLAPVTVLGLFSARHFPLGQRAPVFIPLWRGEVKKR
jgi:hypothetical protein